MLRLRTTARPDGGFDIRRTRGGPILARVNRTGPGVYTVNDDPTPHAGFYTALRIARAGVRASA